MKLCIACVSLVVLGAPAAHTQAAPRGQTAAEHVALGDKDHVAMNAPSALKHYEAALKVDSLYYDALIDAARESIDVGQYNPNEDEHKALYKRAEEYARKAVAAK